VARRHGWNGQPPHNVVDLARVERTTVAVLTKRLSDAERALRASG
jgi:hypothetical protein